MKNFTQNCSFALLLGILSLMNVKAQEADPVWKQAYQQDGITISYAAGTCGDLQMLLLKLENRVSSSFHFLLLLNPLFSGTRP